MILDIIITGGFWPNEEEKVKSLLGKFSILPELIICRMSRGRIFLFPSGCDAKV